MPKNQINPKITGSRASISSDNCVLVVINMTTLPSTHNGARVRMRRDICTIICTWLTSLVARTNSCPVWIWSRLPNENVCTLRTSALRRSAPTFWDTRTENTVLATANRALRTAAPSISSEVVTINLTSPLAIPWLMTRWVKRGINRSAITMPSSNTSARIDCHL